MESALSKQQEENNLGMLKEKKGMPAASGQYSAGARKRRVPNKIWGGGPPWRTREERREKNGTAASMRHKIQEETHVNRQIQM